MSAIGPLSRPPLPSELAHLRPATGLEMLDRTFALIRIRPGMILGFGAAGALLGIMAERLHDPAAPQTALITLAVALASKWPLAAVILVAFQTLLLPRRPLDRGAALRSALSRLPHLFVTTLLTDMMLFTVGLELPRRLLLAPTGGYSLSPLTAALAGAVAASAFYLAALWALAPAVVLLEGRMLFDALRRSSELMRLRFSSRLFGDSALRRLVLLLIVALAVAAAARLTVPTLRWVWTGVPILDLSGVGKTPSAVGWEITEFVVACLALSFFWPYLQTALALLYAECRIRREGIDLQTRLLVRQGQEPPGESM